MATLELITLICDKCGKERDDVQTHSMTVDGHAREFEACEPCWTRIGKAVAVVIEQGRKIPRQYKPRKG